MSAWRLVLFNVGWYLPGPRWLKQWLMWQISPPGTVPAEDRYRPRS